MPLHPLIEISQALLEYGRSQPPEVLFPTVIPDAAHLAVSDPYAFCIATCLDRGAKADVIWTIPYDIKKFLGHLDPHKIYNMTLEELAEMFSRLPRRPRYVNDAPRTIQELTRFVVEECDGDASLIWEGRHPADVKGIFLSIHGVGPGIASMAVLLIEKAFQVRFRDMDRPSMNIKPDVHTMRVLYRLGASKDKLSVIWPDGGGDPDRGGRITSYQQPAEVRQADPPDTLTQSLVIDDKLVKDILKNIYYPDSPYAFAVMPAEPIALMKTSGASQAG